MATDIKLGQDMDVEIDSANDVALISGLQQLNQKYALDVKDELQDFVAGKLDGETIGQIEERIASGLDDDPAVGSVDSVTIDRFERGTSTLYIDVFLTRAEDFTMQLNVNA